MQHAADKFERAQPASLKRIPFEQDDIEAVPGAMEAIGWVFLAFCFGILFVGFLGL